MYCVYCGMATAARIPIIATAIINSMRVKPFASFIARPFICVDTDNMALNQIFLSQTDRRNSRPDKRHSTAGKRSTGVYSRYFPFCSKTTMRSEEHTSELQAQVPLLFPPLLFKK